MDPFSRKLITHDASSTSIRSRVPWPQRLPQRFLFCLACASPEVCARGLCRSCYDAAYHDDSYFAGAKANVLARDGHCCRACGTATNVVHHRQPGCDEEQWLITLCPACHATVGRLERLDRYLPPVLLTLWREQHPDAGEQLVFDLEISTPDPQKALLRTIVSYRQQTNTAA